MRIGTIALLQVTLVVGCGRKSALPVRGDAAVADAPAAPARAECEAAVSNMQKLAPALVPGDKEDVDECMKLPRPLVLCVQKARSSEEADACVDRAAAAPAPRASEASCKQMAAHYVSLLPAKERDESSEASMLAACKGRLTPGEVECVLAARTRADAEACLD
jgi:hypothetical protein